MLLYCLDLELKLNQTLSSKIIIYLLIYYFHRVNQNIENNKIYPVRMRYDKPHSPVNYVQFKIYSCFVSCILNLCGLNLDITFTYRTCSKSHALYFKLYLIQTIYSTECFPYTHIPQT